MSLEYTFYTIVGYDVTNMVTDKNKLVDWSMEEGFDYCNHTNSPIQIFVDPTDQKHVYIGKIIWETQEFGYEGDVVRDIDDLYTDTDVERMKNLFDIMWVDHLVADNNIITGNPKLICFMEWE